MIIDAHKTEPIAAPDAQVSHGRMMETQTMTDLQTGLAGHAETVPKAAGSRRHRLNQI